MTSRSNVKYTHGVGVNFPNVSRATAENLLYIMNKLNTIFHKQESGDDDSVNKSIAQVVTIVRKGYDFKSPWSKQSETQTASGTGWFIRLSQQPPDEPTQYLITCAHCVENSVPEDGVSIIVPSYTKYAEANNLKRKIPVDVIAIFPEIDACLLKIKNKFGNNNNSVDKQNDVNNDERNDVKAENDQQQYDFKALELDDDTNLQDNEKLKIYGFPLATETLKIIESHYNGRESFRLQLDGSINQGHSGAAIIRTSNNKVVGYITSGIENASGVSFGSPSGMLKPLLDAVDISGVENNKNVQIIRQGDLGLCFYKSYNEMKGFLNTNCNGGLLIDTILSNSQFRSNSNTDVNKNVNVDEDVNVNDLLCAMKLSDIITNNNNNNNKEKSESGWHEISNEGKVQVPHWKGSTKSITLSELIQRWPVGANVDLKIFSNKNRVEMILKNKSLNYFPMNGYLTVMHPWQQIDYEVIAGLVVVPLTADVRKLAKYILPKDLDKPALIVTRIIKPSTLSEQDVDLKGVLKYVNDIPVATLQDFRSAILKPVNNYLIFQNENNKKSVLPLNNVLKKEKGLSKSNQYTISPLIKELEQIKTRKHSL